MSLRSLIAVILLASSVDFVSAQQMRLDVGPRAIVTLADGEPTNDMIGNGVFLNYRWTDRWALSVTYEQLAYDVEEPARILGLVQDPSVDPIDAEGESSLISASIRRNYPRGRARTSWFWSVGGGVGEADVEDARGPLASGDIFDIETDAGSELVALASVGINIRLLDRFYLEVALRADQHFADWELRDRQSGVTGSIDDYLATGGHFGIGVRF